MRIFSAFVPLLLLAGCGSAIPDPQRTSNAAAGTAVDAAPDGRIACALPGATTFAPQCTVDRAETQEGVVLTVHQPDGGFHRLRLVDDGRGVVAADGAEEAKVAVLGADGVEVAIGGARYRLPARVGSLLQR
jgi:hypothetical protein